MGLFRKKSKDIPMFDDGREPVLRCSICTGEQVLCLRDRGTGELTEIMLIRDFDQLEEICEANHIDPSKIEKIY